jgi:large subunit ribosomal protein L4
MAEDKEKNTKHLVLEALYYQETNRRRGTAKMKTRGEVRGGGVKPWRQKGTGRARQGSIRAVQWVGGGRAFGSRRNVYDLKMNKKARRAAIQALIQAKKDEGRYIADTIAMDAPSTKAFIKFMAGKSMDGKVLLVYTANTPAAIVKSARNIPEVTTLISTKLNAKDLLNNDWLLVRKEDEEALLNPSAAAATQGE